MWKLLLVGAFNHEKALIGAFTVIVQLRQLIVCSTSLNLFGVIPPDTGIMGPSREAGDQTYDTNITENSQKVTKTNLQPLLS